jgi:hypothetical protein
MWTGLVWLRIGIGGELLWIRYWTFGFYEMLGNYRVASRVVFSSMELVSYIVCYLPSNCTRYVGSCLLMSTPRGRRTALLNLPLKVTMLVVPGCTYGHMSRTSLFDSEVDLIWTVFLLAQGGARPAQLLQGNAPWESASGMSRSLREHIHIWHFLNHVSSTYLHINWFPGLLTFQNIRGLNLAAVKRTTVQLSRLLL